MFELIKPRVLRVPMTSNNATVSACGQGFWTDVSLGHTLPPYLAGDAYLNFLQYVLHGLLEDVPLHMRQNMWFQHDGTPPHFSFAVPGHLDRRFGQTWLSRGGPITSPARSSDLTLLEVLLCVSSAFWIIHKNLFLSHFVGKKRFKECINEFETLFIYIYIYIYICRTKIF